MVAHICMLRTTVDILTNFYSSSTATFGSSKASTPCLRSYQYCNFFLPATSLECSHEGKSMCSRFAQYRSTSLDAFSIGRCVEHSFLTCHNGYFDLRQSSAHQSRESCAAMLWSHAPQLRIINLLRAFVYSFAFPEAFYRQIAWHID